ncbi:hypothetical protein PT974_00187 [Cladobotryum mycophilum]|uniref:Uncharacterized protein n=1 Tax=Cladobotryum mycophilum TaxID=491253 RepID=A0ABR0T077_9HYPO
MSSYVSEFIINPVLRQARRFSEISRTTFGGDEETPPAQANAMDTDNIDNALQENDAQPEPMRLRTFSSSTHETIVEEPQTPVTTQPVTLDHLGFPIVPRGKHGGPIPEDDGMRMLRTRIQEINARDIPSTEKARLLHDVILEGYRSSLSVSRVKNVSGDLPAGQTWEHSEPTGPLDSLRFWQNQLIGESVIKDTFTLSASDIAPTFVPIRHPKTETTTPTSSSSTLPQGRAPWDASTMNGTSSCSVLPARNGILAAFAMTPRKTIP